jgi:hypothetical protein
VTLPNDPLDALKWAMNHSGDAWWVVGLIIAGIAWTMKRLRAWSARNTVVTSAPATPPAAASPARPAVMTISSYAAAPSYAAAGYTAQPAYAAPPPATSSQAPARKLQRETAPARRAATPAARSVDVPGPAATGRWTLAGAFGDPAHARTAIVIAEVLGPPVGLR